MSLQVWLPLTKDLRNQGLSNVTVTNNGATFNSAGKLGGCYKTSSSGLIELGYDGNKINTESISLGGWFKFNKSEISSIVTGYSYTSTYPFPTGNIIGNDNYAGVGLIWTGNTMADGTAFNTLSVKACLRTATNGARETASYSIPFDTWTHIFMTFDKSTSVVKLYINGELHSSFTGVNFTDAPSRNLYINYKAIYGGNGPSYYIPFYCNDIRIYDHCLSPIEVKELAKGLVLHYPLTNASIQQLNNCYSYPRFETTNSNGGWSHWGRTGASGTQGQSTDSNYIFHPDQTYSHWVANAASATGEYLLYQSPAFEGGSRSLQCICKEVNGGAIDESIVFPAWNARSGGAVNNKWTSVTSLGNGFYLCKCEDIQQDGSNDLVGFYICPGKTVYFSEAYLENDRTCCSDIFHSTTIIYDCSGFCNNSILNTSAIISADTAKYIHSTYFGEYNTPKTDLIDNSLLPALTNCTITWWEKNDTTRTLLLTGQTTSHYIAASDGNTYYHGTVNGTKTLYRDGVAGTYSCEASKWHHYALVGVDISSWTALHLNSYGSYWYLKGLVSDLRIYATILSDEDILELYQQKGYANSFEGNNLIYYEYIQNNDLTQYIDLQTSLVNKTIEVKFQQTPLVNKVNTIYGGEDGATPWYAYGFRFNSGTAYLYLNGNLDTTGVDNSITTPAPDENIHIFRGIHKINQKSSATLDGEALPVVETIPNKFSTRTALLFATKGLGNPGGLKNNNLNLRIYYFKIWDENDNLTHYLRPCSYNGHTGMWNEINNTFYPNCGKGEFTCGNIIEN